MSPPEAAASDAQAPPVVGWRSPEVEEELPALRLLSVDVSVARTTSLTGGSAPDVEARLRELSNRFRGARGVSIRREPVPSAYRVFFRHIGLDPDAERTPIETAVLDRMLHGGFLSRGLLEDVLLISLLDTGVPIWALDAGPVQGQLGIRLSRDGEPLGCSSRAFALPAGQLVVADESAALAILFGELGDGYRPKARSRRLVLFSLQVAGVPTIYVEEALWACHASLQQP